MIERVDLPAQRISAHSIPKELILKNVSVANAKWTAAGIDLKSTAHRNLDDILIKKFK